MMPWTPQDISAFDQLLAQTEADLDRWIDELRKQTAEHGEMQGAANMTLALTHVSRDGLCGMLLCALVLLNRRDRKEEP